MTKTIIWIRRGDRSRLYSKMDREKLIFCKERRKEKMGDGADRHNDYVEIFDEISLHTINGSDLQYDDEQLHQSKNCQLEDLIDNFLLS